MSSQVNKFGITRYGEQLEHDIVHVSEDQAEAIVRGLLYENEVLMIAADPGLGKSVVAMNIALQLTAGGRLFGEYEIPKPRSVYYFQLEGNYNQCCRRMNMMGDQIQRNTKFLAWNELRMMNVLDEGWCKQMIEHMKQIGAPEVVIIDPIYKSVVGGLSKEEPSQAIVRFTDMLREAFNCAVILIHHTHKTKHDNKGQRVDEDYPFYGSQWLQAHVDTSYYMKRGNRKNRVTLFNKKDRNSHCIDLIALSFDPKSFTVWAETDQELLMGYEKVYKHLQKLARGKQTTTFVDVAKACKVSQAQLRRYQKTFINRKLIVCNKTLDSTRIKIWEPQEKLIMNNEEIAE